MPTAVPKVRESRARPARAKARRAATSATDRQVQTALASLAHEVRTPLNGILVLAELLAASDLATREREWAVALKSAAEHLDLLTTMVVDGARAGLGTLTLKHEVFDPHALATALGQSLEVRATVRGLAPEIRLSDGLARQVSGDPVLLRSAIENLLDNAVKFTGRGCVSLTATSEMMAEGIRLTFTVADDGIGMTAAETRRLFRPFGQANARVARQYRGAGLGLAFARQVARAMGGDLTVASVPGQGTTFRFSVVLAPLAAHGQSCAAKGADGAEVLPGKPLRILCAEDNPYGRVMFNTMAAALGHGIDFATSGEAAVVAVENGHYDIVLMDVTLAGMDGVEATRKIRALAPPAGHVPIVGVSGRSDPEEERIARAAGMNDYLVKPISPRALAVAIGSILQD
jgi:CheY-like chemotaxis protein